MDNSFFDMAIQEIESVYGSLKLTADQKIGWYSRLKDFSEDDTRLAVTAIITLGLKPTYQTLEAELKKARRKLDPNIPILSATYLVEKGGACPTTDESLDLTKRALQGLASLMKMRKGEKKKQFANELKENWLMAFSNLPDYTPEDQIMEYAEAKDFRMLEILNVLNPAYPKERPEVPFLHIEKNFRSTGRKADIVIDSDSGLSGMFA